ncbi:MAG: PilZ domain-containing protein [Xanthomonadales bacterium]|nr:PilZ domain-containing protein [Xanthomonadales bacterium]
MVEKRLNKRVNPPDGSVVINQLEGKVLGKIVDVSAGGFLLAGREKFCSGMIFQLNLVIAMKSKISLSVGAECIWSDPQASGLTFGGFQIIDISDGDRDKLNTAINKLDH